MAAPAATAFANASSGSSLINTILTVPPPSVSGLKFLCSGDSSATQNSAPSIERRATTAPSGASIRYTTLAARRICRIPLPPLLAGQRASGISKCLPLYSYFTIRVKITRPYCRRYGQTGYHRSSLPALLVCYSAPRSQRAPFPAWSLRSSQFAGSTRFGVRPSVHPRSLPPGEYGCVPFSPAARNRQENLGSLLHKRRLLL